MTYEEIQATARLLEEQNTKPLLGDRMMKRSFVIRVFEAPWFGDVRDVTAEALRLRNADHSLCFSVGGTAKVRHVTENLSDYSCQWREFKIAEVWL